MHQINPKERKLIGDLLELASSEFSNHCCNDAPDDLFEGWTEEEKINLDKRMHEANGDPEEHDPNCVCFMDWWLMSYFADRHREQAVNDE
jgi:hypothetical protein